MPIQILDDYVLLGILLTLPLSFPSRHMIGQKNHRVFFLGGIKFLAFHADCFDKADDPFGDICGSSQGQILCLIHQLRLVHLL